MEVTENILDNNIVIISVKGELSIFYIDPFENIVQKNIVEGKYKFIFDFREVTYIDSMGIGLLSIAGNNAAQNGSKIAVIVTNPKVRYTLNISKLNEIIEIVETKEDAIKVFNK